MNLLRRLPAAVPRAIHRPYSVTATTAPLANSFPQPRPTDPPIIVVSGPSGAGKSTLLKRLLAMHPNVFGFSVSHTTRTRRPAERNGADYNFVNTTAFSNLLSQGAFLEHAAFAGNLYGTSLKAIKDVRSKGLVPLLDLELKGVKRVAEVIGAEKARFALVLPPSLDVLEQRLRGRGTEADEVIRQRLDRGRKEMEGLANASWNIKITNDDPEAAFHELERWALGVVNESSTAMAQDVADGVVVATSKGVVA